MTSTGYQPVVVDPATTQASEQGEQSRVEPAAESCRQAESVFAVDLAEGIGAPLVVAFVGAMALVVAIVTPVAGARIGALLIVAVTVAIVCRLLARRGGGSR